MPGAQYPVPGAQCPVPGDTWDTWDTWDSFVFLMFHGVFGNYLLLRLRDINNFAKSLILLRRHNES